MFRRPMCVCDEFAQALASLKAELSVYSADLQANLNAERGRFGAPPKYGHPLAACHRSRRPLALSRSDCRTGQQDILHVFVRPTASLNAHDRIHSSNRTQPAHSASRRPGRGATAAAATAPASSDLQWKFVPSRPELRYSILSEGHRASHETVPEHGTLRAAAQKSNTHTRNAAERQRI